MMRAGLGTLGGAVAAAAVIVGISLVGQGSGGLTPSAKPAVHQSTTSTNPQHSPDNRLPGSTSTIPTPWTLKSVVARRAAAAHTSSPTEKPTSPSDPTPSAPTPTPQSPPPPALSCPGLGLFVAGENPASITALAAQLGVIAGMMTVYANQPDYTQFTPPSTSMRLLLGVGEVTPAEATTIGDTLVATGHANTMIRIMWEMNGNWFPWGTQSLSAAQYIAIYQAAEEAFAAVPGNGFQYVWNVNAGTAEPGRTEFDTYPGSAYVSNVGIDYYDGNTSTSQISTIIDFAQSQGKALSFDEWGVNGDDDPGYIDYISEIVHNTTYDVTAQAYFSDGNSTLTSYPLAEAEYHKDFSVGC